MSEKVEKKTAKQGKERENTPTFGTPVSPQDILFRDSRASKSFLDASDIDTGEASQFEHLKSAFLLVLLSVLLGTVVPSCPQC